VLPLVAGILLLRNLSKESMLVLIIVFLACIPQIFHGLHVRNAILKSLTYNLYTPAEFFLLFMVFRKHIEVEKNRLLLNITAGFYTLASLFFIAYFGLLKNFIPEWAALNNLIYTLWILTVILEQYRYTNNYSLDFNSPFLWFVMGLLFYAPCTAMIFSMWNYIENTDASPLKIVHAIFNINMYLLFAVGFWKDKQLTAMITV